MLYKRDIINGLFIASFPVYGIGTYISATRSPSLGYMVSVAPHVVMLMFYLIDLIYRREFTIRVTGLYGLMTAFLVSCVISLFVALNKNLPELNNALAIVKSVMVIVPFQAFIIVHLYNERRDITTKLAFTSLSLLLAINLVGYYVLGLGNEVHSIEGRVNFPFIDGIYSGSCLVAILALMLVYNFRGESLFTAKSVAVVSYLILNVVLLFLINSRITIMIFLVVLLLLVLNLMGRFKGVFWTSLFTIPILLSTGLLIYKILSLPLFSSILQRVDIVDVTTFNGRAFLWQDVMDWIWYDRQGFILGNGFRGHYFFNLVSDVAEMWNEKDLYHLHLHSTSLEILVCQGAIMYAIYLVIFYRTFGHYQKMHRQGNGQGMLLAVVVFLMFIMQVDTFLYMETVGAVIFSWLVAAAAIRTNDEPTQKKIFL